MMKKYLLHILGACFILFLFIPSRSYGSSLIQKTVQSSQQTINVTATLPSNTASGNLLIVAVTTYISQVTSITDSLHNTFTQIPNSPQANGSGPDRVYLYYAKNIAAGTDTITTKFDSANHIRSIGVYEYSGLDIIAPFDKSAGGIGNTITVSPGSIIPASDGSLIFSIGNDYAVNENSTPIAGANYTLEDHIDNSATNERFYIEDYIQPVSTITTALFTTQLAGHFEVITGVFKKASPTPTPTPIITPTPTMIPTPTPSPLPLSINHIVVVFEEDHELQQVLATDYFTTLANQGALMVNSHGVTHPSTPNYFAFLSGSTQGLTDNTCPPPGSPFSAQNLGSQLLAANLTFTGFYEQPSVNCVGTFAWEWFSNIPSSDSQLFTNFPTDYTLLPTVSLVLPNLQDNMHNGTVQEASDWIKTNIDAYKTWAMNNNSLLIVTTDEDDINGSDPIYTVFVGPMIKKGIYNESINHYNILSTIENKYGLPQLNPATPISDIFQ